MVQKFQRVFARPVRRGPASVASRQALATMVPNLIPSAATRLEPSSWWPEPMDLDPSDSDRWPEPMDLDPPGLLVWTPLDIKFEF
jgi:hypothetical protein